MARISNASPVSPIGVQSFDHSSVELGYLLARLQTTVLHPDPVREQRLRTNHYERAKIGSNLEYARNSLTKLEQDAMAVLAPRRRAELQADLNAKREILETLLDRLQDYNKMAADDDHSDDGISDGEDIISGVIHTPSESQESTAAGDPEPDLPPTTGESLAPVPTVTQAPAATASFQSEPTHTTQTLRSRGGVKASSAEKSQPPVYRPTSYASARAALFAQRQDSTGGASTSPNLPSTATAEAILDRQAAEREDLANKVFQMAKAMKKQQQSIYDSLETEKDVLSRATEGMERTGRGMEVARGRMGMLQKMTEGTGFLGRMRLYAMVYGLMVALLLLVFVMPKLRF